MAAAALTDRVAEVKRLIAHIACHAISSEAVEAIDDIGAFAIDAIESLHTEAALQSALAESKEP